VSNLSGDIAFRILRDGQALPSRTDYAWTGGGMVLTIATVLPEHELAFELVSIYAAAVGTDTIVTHIICGRGLAPEITAERHEDANHALHPVDAPRGCAYDHAQRLIDTLSAQGVSVEISEQSFQALERVE
jgi:hypothetical protein